MSRDWDKIELKYSESSSIPWEDFKKEYYSIDNRIKKTLEKLQKFQIDFSKKISIIEY